MADSADGNGSKTIEDMAQEKVFQGATVDLGSLQRQDGIITQAMDKLTRTNLGIIQTFIHAEKDDENYRQILKNAIWKNTHEQDLFTLAITCCDLTGATVIKRLLLDRLTARSAGTNGWAQLAAYEALTHTTFTSQHVNTRGNKKGVKPGKTNSPLT